MCQCHTKSPQTLPSASRWQMIAVERQVMSVNEIYGDLPAQGVRALRADGFIYCGLTFLHAGDLSNARAPLLGAFPLHICVCAARGCSKHYNLVAECALCHYIWFCIIYNELSTKFKGPGHHTCDIVQQTTGIWPFERPLDRFPRQIFFDFF